VTCEQEMCRNWTGFGCACAVLDIEPDTTSFDDREHACRSCWCSVYDHNADELGGGCTNCGTDCEGYR